MNFVNQLPSQLILNDFVSGKVFTLEQSRKIFKAIAVDSEIDYESQMAKAKLFIKNNVDTVVTPDIVSMLTNEEIDDITKLLIIRFVNLVYKGNLPIVLNEDIIYMPKSMQEFNQFQTDSYVDYCLSFVVHDNNPLTEEYHARNSVNKETSTA